MIENPIGRPLSSDEIRRLRRVKTIGDEKYTIGGQLRRSKRNHIPALRLKKESEVAK